MDTPSPNPKDGAASVGSDRGEVAGGTRPPLAVPGPSGIKQCFKTVKAPRRDPLPKLLPKSTSTTSGRSRRSNEATKRHECRACNKRFSSPSKLSEHQFSHTGELPYSCQLCDKKFNSKSKLARHGLTHRTARAFACFKCDKSFHRKDHLSNHVRVHDPVRRLLVCEQEGCGKHYSSTLSFRKHSAIHAAEGGRLDCAICGVAFTESAKLLQHLKMHTGTRSLKNENEKKFQCVHCDRRFLTAKDVRRHQVVHTGRRDFACIYCPQKFGRKDHLVRHVKSTHTDCPWPPAPELLESAQVVVCKTEENPKPANLTYLGLKYLPSVSVTYAESDGHSSTATQSSVFVNTSADTSLFVQLPIESVTVIKQEPQSDVIETDTSNLDNTNLKKELISAELGDNLPDMICAPEPLASTDYELEPNVIYVMPPAPTYDQLEVLKAVSVSSVEYLSTLEDSTLGEIEVSRSVQSMVDPNLESLGFVQEEDMDSILIEPEDSMEELTLPSQLMDLIEGSSLLTGSEQATVLPTFHQAFQSTAQSPKPPSNAPK